MFHVMEDIIQLDLFVKLVSIKSSGKEFGNCNSFQIFIGFTNATSTDCCELVGIDENAEKIVSIFDIFTAV